MTERVIGPTGSPRRRWTLLLPLVAVFALGVLYIAGAQAVNATGAFELDGNAISAGGNAGTGPDDWDRVCQEIVGGTSCSTTATTQTTDPKSTARTWIDATEKNIFTGGGSKDPQDVSEWLWKPKDTVPDKDTLTHAFAARYSLPVNAQTCPAPAGATTCEVIFFGMDRFANDGDAQLGFWFFQSPVGLTQTSSQGGFKFSGVHRKGDLLLISNFSNGGTTSTISAYFWDPTCTKAANNDPQPGQCAAANLKLQAQSTNANCSTSTATANFCGVVNASNGTVAPWPYTDKGGNSTFQQGEFFEGGVNLSGLGIGDECFSAVAAESRSSTSPTSVLKDFVLGGFGECGSTTVTTPSDNATPPAPIGTPTIPAGGTLQVTDKAVVTVTGVQTWSGTVSYWLCGPADLAPTTDKPATCTAGGTKIGADKGAAGPSPATVYSDPATITKAGKYCWRATFNGDASKGVPASTDASATECFTVNPRQPTLATQAVDASGNAITTSVALGTTLYDTATLGNTANRPGSLGTGPGDASINPTTAGTTARGTITFKLYGPTATAASGGATDTAFATACTTLASGFPAAGITVNVTNGNGTYGGAGSTPAVGYQPTSPGYYHWKADYSGDLPNTLSETHNGTCTESTERVQIQQIPTAIATTPFLYPQDSVSIKSSIATDNLPVGGTVVFKLFNSLTNCQNGASVTTVGTSAGLVYIETKTNVVPTAANEVTGITTSNALFKMDASNNGTTYYWRVTYAPGDQAHTGRQSACAENTAATQTSAAYNGTVFP